MTYILVIRNQNIKNETDSEVWKLKITPILHLWKQLNHVSLITNNIIVNYKTHPKVCTF